MHSILLVMHCSSSPVMTPWITSPSSAPFSVTNTQIMRIYIYMYIYRTHRSRSPCRGKSRTGNGSDVEGEIYLVVRRSYCKKLHHALYEEWVTIYVTDENNLLSLLLFFHRKLLPQFLFSRLFIDKNLFLFICWSWILSY